MTATTTLIRSPPWWQLLGVVVLLALLWRLRDAAVLFFGAVLVAATLRALAGPLVHLGLRARWAVVLVTLLLLVLSIVGLWLLGGPLSEQLQQLRDALPPALHAFGEWVRQLPFGARLMDWVGGLGTASMPWGDIANFATRAMQGVTGFVLIVLMGIYLAIDVGLYRDGLVRLMPVRRRTQVRTALDAAGEALTRWLLGTLVTMVIIGVAVAAGLWLLGMPLALTLGLIAGLLEFIPFFGPIASGALAVLVGFSQGPQQALYVALLFVAVQQVEGNVLVPVVQRWAVKLPPVMSLIAVVVFGSLFGIMGIVVATPLIVVLLVLVRRLYVEETLEAQPA